MRLLSAICFGIVALTACATAPVQARDSVEAPRWVIAIHGGAGVILKENLSPADEAAILADLAEALSAGSAVLQKGGEAVDAVTAAILVLEDSPYFNAGKGAVFTADGTHELDASIMVGSNRDAGAVAGIKTIRHPILAARAVMENSPHVMFAGDGADAFAQAQGLEVVDNSWFDTDSRRAALERVLETRQRTSADNAGTVGAIAIDVRGTVAAGTSTGGMTAKAAGRVGDSPLIGAATYAQDGVCAVSATGHGEYFIRVGVAKSICTRMQFLGEDGQTAGETVLGEVADLGGDGGLIIMDGEGNVFFVFNTPGMYRGMLRPGGAMMAIYGDDE